MPFKVDKMTIYIAPTEQKQRRGSGYGLSVYDIYVYQA